MNSMGAPLYRYIDMKDLIARICRDHADELRELNDNAYRVLADALLGGDAMMEVDANGNPLALVNAEKIIAAALGRHWGFQDRLEEQGRRE
jgi:hypothetical protein